MNKEKKSGFMPVEAWSVREHVNGLVLGAHQSADGGGHTLKPRKGEDTPGLCSLSFILAKKKKKRNFHHYRNQNFSLKIYLPYFITTEMYGMQFR